MSLTVRDAACYAGAARRMFALVTALGVALCGAPLDLDAQGSAVINNQYCPRVNPAVPQIRSIVNGSIADTCTFWGTATTSASSVNGILRASTSFDASTIPPGVFFGGGSFGASADWSDQLVAQTGIGGPNAAFALLTFSWNGMLVAGAGGANALFVAQSTSGGAYNARPFDVLPNGSPVAVQESFSLLMPLYQNGNSFSNGLYMALYTSANGFGVNTDAGASALFSNSGGLSGVAILDANQQRISTASYQFTQGLQLYAPVSVPEPGTGALLLAGGVALFMVTRRQRA